MADLLAEYTRVQMDYDNAARRFGEDPTKIPSGDFFQLVSVSRYSCLSFVVFWFPLFAVCVSFVVTVVLTIIFFTLMNGIAHHHAAIPMRRFFLPITHRCVRLPLSEKRVWLR